MHHACAGGKRIRPFLLSSAAECFGKSASAVIPAACAVEMFHCATLVHDDLPCIDDADLRHGHPACHVAFDEATALLAADALIVLAFECLAQQADCEDITSAQALRCVREMAIYTGATGLIGGEMLDIEAENRDYTEADLEFIHLNKTAKLIMFAVRCGAILAGADEDGITTITDYARALGLLFQVTDDLLDVTADAGVMGKPVGADAEAGKATYPDLLGLDKSRQRAEHFARQARETAMQLPSGDLWLALADMIIVRQY